MVFKRRCYYGRWHSEGFTKIIICVRTGNGESTYLYTYFFTCERDFNQFAFNVEFKEGSWSVDLLKEHGRYWNYLYLQFAIINKM